MSSWAYNTLKSAYIAIVKIFLIFLSLLFPFKRIVERFGFSLLFLLFFPLKRIVEKFKFSSPLSLFPFLSNESTGDSDFSLLSLSSLFSPTNHRKIQVFLFFLSLPFSLQKITWRFKFSSPFPLFSFLSNESMGDSSFAFFFFLSSPYSLFSSIRIIEKIDISELYNSLHVSNHPRPKLFN